MTGTTSVDPTTSMDPPTSSTSSDPSTSTDASPYPVHVPGYGWVSWPRALLDAQARYLTFIHRPNRAPLSQRMRRWLPWRGGSTDGGRTDASVCVFCGLEWLCPEVAWARGWLSPMARLRGRCRPRHRARARARARARGLLGRLRGSSSGPGRAPDRRGRRRNHGIPGPARYPNNALAHSGEAAADRGTPAVG